jgi:hypothetical protein
MKALMKSLTILAIGGSFAGAALAGPGDAYRSFALSKGRDQEKKRIRHDRSVSTRSDIGQGRKETIFNTDPTIVERK